MVPIGLVAHRARLMAVMGGAAALFAAANAAAQEGATGAEAGFSPAPARLKLRVDAMAWYLGPGGELDMPSATGLADGGDIDIDALGYDSPRFVAMPELNITWGDRWRVTLRGYHFDDSHTAVPGFAGQVGSVAFDATSELTSSYSIGSYEAEVAYRIYEFPEELVGVQDRGFFATADIIGGVRAFDLSWSVARTELGSFPGTQSVSVDDVFISPMLGTRLRLDFGNDYGFDVQLDVAGLPLGDGSNASGDVIVGGWWYPWPNVGLQIGYRAASFLLGNGDGPEDYTFGGWNQGLQFGVVVQF